MAPSSVRMALEGTSDTPKLEELVSREALAELIGSVVELFRIPIRVYSETSGLLVDTAQEHEACKYVNSVFAGRSLCGSTVSAVKGLVPEEGDISHPCFTGQKYRVVAVEYESRRIGRLVIGPYLPADLTEVPESLANVAEVELEKVALVLVKSPRAKEETIRKLSEHVRRQLDLVLFSGHKTLLTSQMHLASVTESFREMQEKNRKLEDANQRLRELDRLKTNFLATVSHELRTPLTSIIGYGEMLAEGIAGELNKEQQEFVATIREKGEQLLGLISGLLDLSKLESGTLSVKKRPVTVRSVVDTAYTSVLINARKKGVILKTVVDDDVGEIVADPDRLRQVFINLCDNAIKFTPVDGTVTLSASMYKDDMEDDDDGLALLGAVETKIEIRVSDTGIGIPAHERAKVFDAFYQVDSGSTREYGGTGLGLSIVKRLVEAHQGSIHIEGNKPNGTVFVVRFPKAPPKQS